jgi:hypothetical protein
MTTPSPALGRAFALILAAAAAALTASAARAADFSDPTWPCVQRKVPNLSWGMMWTGMPIDDSLGDWRADPAVAELAPVLAVRRTPMEEAERLIADFAGRLSEEAAPERLALLFKGVFGLIDAERSKIVGGIGRYAQKQIALSEEIDAMRAELAELEAVEDPSFDQQDRMEELQDKILWSTRIYDERQQSLTYVCESPVLMEKRVFALAREIMSHLP